MITYTIFRLMFAMMYCITIYTLKVMYYIMVYTLQFVIDFIIGFFAGLAYAYRISRYEVVKNEEMQKLLDSAAALEYEARQLELLQHEKKKNIKLIDDRIKEIDKFLLNT